MDLERLKYNSVSYLMTCVDRYLKANHLDANDWRVISMGAGTAHDSWHYNITIQSISGMEKTIRIPMYEDKRINFDMHFINEF